MDSTLADTAVVDEPAIARWKSRPGTGMRVALFGTCINDTMFPQTLKAVVTGMYLVTVVEVVIAALALFDSKAPVVLTIGYLLAAVALLPLLGIGRLGEPDAPGSGKTPDPERPILQADQIARVDAVAAIIVAIAAAVVVWRIAVIFEGAL